MKFRYFFVFLLIIVLIGFSIGATYFLTSRGVVGLEACKGNRSFSDTGLGIQMEYPCDWDIQVHTLATRNIVTDQKTLTTGPVLQEYDITLVQDTNKLTFKKILIPVQASPLPIGNGYDYLVLENRFIRYKKTDDAFYTYAKYLPCDEVPNAFRATDINAKDCAAGFFEPFGIAYPTVVTAQTADEDILKVMDTIILGL